MQEKIELEKLNKSELKELINDLVTENEELKAEVEKAEKDCETAKAAAVKAAEVSNAYTRLLADFDAFKKRNAQIAETAKADAAENIAKSLLPILDNFKRAMENIKDESIKSGISMIFSQIQSLLVNLGVEKIQALGCQFDHNLHDAITTVDGKAEDNDKIVNVILDGYKMGEKLIRAAQVIVCKANNNN